MLLRCHQAATCSASLLHKSNRIWLPIASNLHAAQQPCCLPALDTIHGSSSCCSSSGSTSSTRSNWQASPSRPHNRNVHKQSTKLSAKDAGAAGSLDDEDDIDSIKPGKPLRVERLLANLGYGKRKECTVMIKRKQLVYADTGQPAKVGEKALASQLLLDGEALDPPPPLTLLLYKPVGYVVTSPEDEVVLDPKIYDLLPYRFGRRRPFLSAVGRLDKDTSGLLLLTDDGQLLHSIQSPAKGIWKRYRAKLAAPLTGKDAEKAIQRFASGQMQLQGDRTPLLPAALHMLDDTTAEISICEGRYHQIRRMFGALGHEVVELHRHTIGGLSLLDEPDLALGMWRLATPADIDAVMAGPDSLAAAVQQQGTGHLPNDVQQQQQQVSLPSEPAAAAQEAPHSSSSGSDSRLQQAAASNAASRISSDGSSSSVNDEVSDDLDEDVFLEDDVDHPGEAAAAARRFKNSSKRARRKAVLAKNVKAMRTQSQSG